MEVQQTSAIKQDYLYTIYQRSVILTACMLHAYIGWIMIWWWMFMGNCTLTYTFNTCITHSYFPNLKLKFDMVHSNRLYSFISWHITSKQSKYQCKNQSAVNFFSYNVAIHAVSHSFIFINTDISKKLHQGHSTKILSKDPTNLDTLHIIHLVPRVKLIFF